MKKKIITSIIVIILAFGAIIAAYSFYRKSCVVYTVEIHEKDVKISILIDSTDWPFGDSHISIYRNYSKFCEEDISNDGKTLYEWNFEADWDDDFVYLTLKGEEQADETVSIPIK